MGATAGFLILVGGFFSLCAIVAVAKAMRREYTTNKTIRQAEEYLKRARTPKHPSL